MEEGIMMLPMISEKELCEHIEEEDFFIRFGNPVCVRAKDGWKFVCMSIELYNRFMELMERLSDESKL